MEKEEVLKLEYTKINDDYTIATIVYQNEDILKRNFFNDYELKVTSAVVPSFIYNTLYIRGGNSTSDNMPIIIPNERVEFIKGKVKKLNEKYGVVKKWCPNIDDNYYSICFDFISNVSLYSWNGDCIDEIKLSKNLIFRTRTEAMFVANKILENVDKWREEYQKEKKL